MKHMYSLVPLQDLIPTLANNIHHDAKVGIKSCRGAREYICFICACMYVATQLQFYT